MFPFGATALTSRTYGRLGSRNPFGITNEVASPARSTVRTRCSSSFSTSRWMVAAPRHPLPCHGSATRGKAGLPRARARDDRGGEELIAEPAGASQPEAVDGPTRPAVRAWRICLLQRRESRLRGLCHQVRRASGPGHTRCSRAARRRWRTHPRRANGQSAQTTRQVCSGSRATGPPRSVLGRSWSSPAMPRLRPPSRRSRRPRRRTPPERAPIRRRADPRRPGADRRRGP
jgi:hypothetical protein